MLGVEEESEELEGVPTDAIVDAHDVEEQQNAVDAGDGEQQEKTKIPATASQRSTAKSARRPRETWPDFVPSQVRPHHRGETEAAAAAVRAREREDPL